MTEHWTAFLAALAATDQPRATFAALDKISKEVVGTTLFTAMTHDTANQRSYRNYSDNETAYPTGAWKAMKPGSPWGQHVLEEKKIFVANTIEEIAVVFPDADLIASLGCGSAINVPGVYAGRVIGTINLLHETGYYTPERVAKARELIPFVTTAFLTITPPLGAYAPA